MTFARHTLGSLVTLAVGIAASIVLARVLGAEARGEYGLAVKAAGLVLAIAQWGMPEVLLQFMGQQPGVSDQGSVGGDRRSPASSQPPGSADRGEASEATAALAGEEFPLSGSPPPGAASSRGQRPKRHVPAGEAACGERGDHRALVGTTLALGLGTTVLVALGLLAALPLLERTLLAGVSPLLVWVALGGSVLSMLGLLARRFIQLHGRIDLYNGLDLGRTALFLALAVGLVFGLQLDAFGAVSAWLLAELALALAAGVYLWRRLARRWSWDGRLAWRLVAAGVPVQVGVVATFLGNEAGAYVLNATLDLATVGVYLVALSVARLVLQISMALRTALQPRLIVPGTDSVAMTFLVARHGVLWMMLLSLGLALVGAPLVPRVFGTEYGAASLALVLMLPGMLAYGLMQLLGSHLLRIGKRGILAVSSGTLALAAVGLQAAGALAGGLNGAAAGLSLAYALSAAVVLVACVRLTGHSARELVPSMADLRVYRSLVRDVLARRSGRPAAHPAR